MSEAPIRLRAGGIAVAVRLTPKGGRDRIERFAAGADGRRFLKARVSAPPEDGKANDALIALLAHALDVARTKVRIVSGSTARMKMVEVEGDAALLAARLTEVAEPS